MINNKLKYILFGTLLSLLMTLSSCNDFLNVTPTGETDTPTALSDVKGMRSALAGTYQLLHKFYSGDYYAYADLAGNTISLASSTQSARAKSLYNYEYEPFVVGYWGTLYEVLANINNIIEYQPTVAKEYPTYKNELERIKAQALFLRALCHFELCKVYGRPYNCTAEGTLDLGVPIILRTPAYNTKPIRNTVNEVYAQVIKDLEESIDLFGDTSINEQAKGKYSANREAAYGLLSRVYLYMENWEKVIDYSSLVIDKVPLATAKDYQDMYRELEKGETEIIFRLNGTLNKANSLMTLFNLTVKKNENDGSETYVAPSALVDVQLLSLFAADTHADDIRYNTIIEKIETKEKNVFYVTNKFKAANTDSEYEHFNPIILRASEMYLNRAEAYAKLNDLPKAAADVKSIIARAREMKVEDVVVPETNKVFLERVIENERTKELSFEGHQLFDILRRKQDVVRSANTTSKYQRIPYWSHKFLKPIPQRELEANDSQMVQNPQDPDQK